MIWVRDLFIFHEKEKNVYCSGVESKQFLAQPWHLHPNTSTTAPMKDKQFGRKVSAINNCTHSLYIYVDFTRLLSAESICVWFMSTRLCVFMPFFNPKWSPNYHKIVFYSPTAEGKLIYSIFGTKKRILKAMNKQKTNLWSVMKTLWNEFRLFIWNEKIGKSCESAMRLPR